jgi:hypothetical protein
MSSEVHKYIETALEKKEKLFKAEVLNFPKDKKNEVIKDFKIKSENEFWKINDESNDDQLKAVIGICYMFGALILMGLYSNIL